MERYDTAEEKANGEVNWSLFDKDKKNEGRFDPVTNLEIKEPMKNLACGHIYEKTTVLKLMTKPGMVCPVQDCNNVLKSDDMYEHKMKKTGYDSDSE